MTNSQTEPQEQTDISVLREMVRLAENRRSEELQGIEKVNRYNLALIAFCGTFLSLIITNDFPVLTLSISGLLLSLSIIFSCIALAPRTLKGGVLTVDEDAIAIQNGQKLFIHNYLLDIAFLTDKTAQQATLLAAIKRKWTILSASLLAFSIVFTYIISVCHALRIL